MYASHVSTSFWSRQGMASTDFLRNSAGMEDMTSLIRYYSSSSVLGLEQYTSSFTQPQRKKSHGVNSGLLTGHSCGPRRPNQRPGRRASSHSRTLRAKWGGTPSCINIRSSMFSQGHSKNCNIELGKSCPPSRRSS